jgi:hypothetical protein
VRSSLLLILALAALAGCKTVAHGDVYEADIKAALAKQGREAEVQCPDRIRLGTVRENHFDCVIVWQSGETPVSVQLDAKGGWKLTPK